MWQQFTSEQLEALFNLRDRLKASAVAQECSAGAAAAAARKPPVARGAEAAPRLLGGGSEGGGADERPGAGADEAKAKTAKT